MIYLVRLVNVDNTGVCIASIVVHVSWVPCWKCHVKVMKCYIKFNSIKYLIYYLIFSTYHTFYIMETITTILQWASYLRIIYYHIKVIYYILMSWNLFTHNHYLNCTTRTVEKKLNNFHKTNLYSPTTNLHIRIYYRPSRGWCDTYTIYIYTLLSIKSLTLGGVEMHIIHM